MTPAPLPTRIDLQLPPGGAAASHVWVGRDLADVIARDLAAARLGHRYALLTEPLVAALHAAPLERALEAAGIRVERLEFPGGEERKTRETKAAVEDRLVASGFGRDAVILALGGGVVGDIAGFVAATYHRGVPWVALPTTLLAMVDAAIGGKTGIDLPGGKNLIGAFHPPSAVYADLVALDTLPDGRLREGFAEVLKHALVADPELAAFLEEHSAELQQRSPAALHRAVDASIRVKAAIVSEDPREAGRRAVLNFGHTVAHAIESASAYRISHGAAVAIGLVLEAGLSASAGFLDPAEVARIRRLVGSFALPTRVPSNLDPQDLVERCARDKKVRAGEIRLALLCRVGEAAGSDAGWTFVVTREQLLEAFRSGSEQGDA